MFPDLKLVNKGNSEGPQEWKPTKTVQEGHFRITDLITYVIKYIYKFTDSTLHNSQHGVIYCML